MKVLLVIHGYPHRYNAGSEVYTQTLAHALCDAGCAVEIFAREEDPFLPDYHLRSEYDPINPSIPVHLVNHARSNARFQNKNIDAVFRGVIDKMKPDVVHFGHLNHLSMGLPEVAKSMGLATVFTLHDYWLMCPRGQFLQWGLTENEPWVLCDGQDDSKCATKCFNRFIEGFDENAEIQHWENWVGARMHASRIACDAVDLFLAPSHHLMRRHVDEFGLDSSKVEYLDYGFDLSRLEGRSRTLETGLVFGYIGRHHPSKGIHDLIDAFCGLNGESILRIWGRPQGQLTQSLKRRAAQFPHAAARIEWLPEYDNENIIEDVFNRCDCIVVPSIWDENSPLVIHEAQQCGVPVITTGHGGMGEYVQHGVNGLTFKHRDHRDLRSMMELALSDPKSLTKLGRRGYLKSEDGQIPSKEKHAESVIFYYNRVLSSTMEVMS